MVTSPRLSRGFHRLGLFLAAIPLLGGGVIAIFHASDLARIAELHHQKLLCANQKLATLPKDALRQPKETPPKGTKPWEANWELDLKSIGCSDYGTVSLDEAKNPPQFTRTGVFIEGLVGALAIAFGVAAAVYGLVRAIGWVIGGFAAS